MLSILSYFLFTSLTHNPGWPQTWDSRLIFQVLGLTIAGSVVEVSPATCWVIEMWQHTQLLFPTGHRSLLICRISITRRNKQCICRRKFNTSIKKKQASWFWWPMPIVLTASNAEAGSHLTPRVQSGATKEDSISGRVRVGWVRRGP